MSDIGTPTIIPKVDFYKSPGSKPLLVFNFTTLCEQFSTDIDTVDGVTLTKVASGSGTVDNMVTLGAPAIEFPTKYKVTQNVEKGLIGDEYEVLVEITLADGQEYDRYFYGMIGKVGSV